MSAALVWATPDAEMHVMRIARVSSDHPNCDDPKLLGYLIRESHWSPFEMVFFCMELVTTRDIGRQILRHGKGFYFQEFSQRYAIPAEVQTAEFKPREARLQHKRKRQLSVENKDVDVAAEWTAIQASIGKLVNTGYNRAIELGIAKEVARAILPEGLTSTKLYMAGPLRSWIHYLNLRCGEDTQKEHRELATQMKKILVDQLPIVSKALGWTSAPNNDAQNNNPVAIGGLELPKQPKEAESAGP